MTSSGVFTLVSQDDITDSYFTAYSILESRLRNISSPMVSDIEKTHILYVKSRYYPYVSIASEYAKVLPSGTQVIGRTGPELSFTLPTYGDFTNDMVLHVKFDPIGNKTSYLNGFMPEQTNPSPPLLRYCAFPGIRLIENVELRASGGVLIDSYQPEDVIAYKNFFVSRDHKAGWERCYGQDEIQQAAYNCKSYTNILNYSNGYQTPKVYHDSFDMFIPLHLWFCEDVSNALINYNSATSQRVIKIRMTDIGKIVQALVYGTTSSGNVIETTGALEGLIPVTLPITSLKFQAELYVNQLYTYSFISEIMKRDFTFNLIRVHKRQITGISAESGSILLNQLNYPGEFMSVGFRNKKNTSDFDRWHLMGSDFLTPDTNNIRTLYAPGIIWNSSYTVRQLVSRAATPMTSLNPIISDISIVTSGDIEIYPRISYSFFNDYLPVRYNKNSAVISPYDNNMFLVTFCFYPGKFNPSGYFNLSTTRELYIKYWMHPDYTDFINNNFEMVICMSALNFLYKVSGASGDSLNLKYTM